MKNKQINKTLKVRTGKELVSLLDTEVKQSDVTDITSPVGDTEITLLNIWKSLLGQKNFGVKDDFFQTGGNSIKAIQLLSRISSHFNVQLETTDIFLLPTIAQLASLIEEKQNIHEEKKYTSFIEKSERPSMIPLSFSQERLIFIDKLEGSLQYHLPAVIRLKGDLNKDAIESALRQTVNRHESLRTIFIEQDGITYQKIQGKDRWNLEFIDGKKFKNDREGLKNFIQKKIDDPFDLSKDHMLRAALITLGETENILVLTLHHISSDAWSLFIIVEEVSRLYEQYNASNSAELPEPEIQFADYALWQRKYLQGTALENKLEYWKKKLDGVSALNLPTDYRRPAKKGISGALKDFIIDKQLLENIQELSRQNGTTLFMTLLAVFKVLLYRYTGQQDITVGTSIANRPHHSVERLIGFFVNTLTLRSEPDSSISFRDFLKQVKATTLEAYEHQDVPFEKVVDAVVGERDQSRSPLFQVMLVNQTIPDITEFSLGEVKLSKEIFANEISKFDLTFHILETPNGIQGSVEYSTDLFKEETIDRMVVHFTELLKSVVKNPNQSIGLLQMITDSGKKKILKEFGISEADYPKKSITDLFEEQALRTPQATAIVFENEILTYQELNERSNQLAHYLKSEGVNNETLIPLCTERGTEMMTGLLGILKSGAAYVPVDVDLPEERISYIFKDCKAFVAVTGNSVRKNLPSAEGLDIISLDDDKIKKQPKDNLKIKIKLSDLAYIIYTSGSTGQPKGVMIEHRSLVDYVYGLNEKIQINDCRSFALVSTIATDLGNTVIYSSLLSGGELHLFTKESVSNPEFMQDYFNSKKIECLKIVPSHWKALRMDEKLLLPAKLLVFGGEALPSELVEKIRLTNSECMVVNHYGPTETTIGRLLHITEPDMKYDYTIPVGKPFSNTRVYVLSNEMEICPVGVPGQLYIAGDGVARGYLNNPELTNEKFIKNPFEKGRKLMYSTGDLVKYLPDGNIEFIGRADNQVKIRGYRIELGEIENVLHQCEQVSEAAVAVKEDEQGNKRLAAYIVPKEKFDKEAISSYLKDKLPEYMMPAFFIEMERMPLMSNGKINRNSLPDPELSELLSGQFTSPRNEAEIILAEIWQDLLGLDAVGIHDNFFELGGDSIITIQLVSRARRSGYELQVGDVFTYQTIARLSALLDQRSEDLKTVGEQFELTGACGLLPIQQWFFEKEHKDISHFNQSVLLEIDKGVTEPVLKRAIEQLKEHHDALRFKYFKNDGQWNQVYEPESEVSGLITEELQTSSQDALRSLISASADRHQRSLDIEKGDVIRFVLMHTPESETTNRLLIVIHHLAVDGVSWRILLEDLELLVSGLKEGGVTELGPKSSSYRQWYNALENYGKSDGLISQKVYWENAAANYTSLPFDKEYEGDIKAKDTDNLSISLGAEQTSQLLQEVPKAYHTEINDILLSALAKTLCDRSGGDRVVIGMEGHGREQIEDGIDTSRTTGWFTSHYPVLFELNSVKGEGDLIKSVKEQLRRVPDKGLGYGVLKYINKDEKLLNSESPDLIFNYLGQSDNILSGSKWFSLAEESAGSIISEDYIFSNKLSVNAIVQKGELVFHWTYSKKHYEKRTIDEIAENYKNNLEALIHHCLGQEKSGTAFTPSDFGLAPEISYAELDRFLNEPVNGKVRRENFESIYRLSGLQQGILFHGLYDGGEETYIRQLSCNFLKVDTDVFHKSWALVMSRHSALRSAYYADTFNIPVQCVYKTAELTAEELDFRDKNETELTRAIKEFEEKECSRSFDLKAAPLMRISLIRLSEDSYRMVWTWHHLLFDGWSMTVLMEEFLKTYEALVTCKPMIESVQDNFEDYIRYIGSIDKSKEEKYWSDYLSGIEQSTFLPFIETASDRNRGTGLYETVTLAIDEDATMQIQKYSRQNSITVNTVMQGVWSYLLHKYTGNDDITFGVVVSGRPDDLPGVEQRVGMYINTLPLHSEMNKEQSVKDWLRKIQEQQIISRQHQYTPLNEIQGWTSIGGDLFDTIYGFENYPVSKVVSSEKWSLHVEEVRIQEQTNYPLTITIASAEQTHIKFRYNTALLQREFAKEISKHFENVLFQIISEEAFRVDQIELLTEAERNTLLAGFNDTAADYPKDKTVVELFEEQAMKTPDKTALVFGNKILTFKELNEKSNQLAHYLQSQGVKKETLIPICIERNANMLVAILGILKSGGAYVPVDPEYPEERIRYLLEDTGARIVICSDKSRQKLASIQNLNIIEADEDLSVIKNYSESNLERSAGPNDLAYVIYTSGSTGNPKGVMVEHRNLLNYLLNKKTNYVTDDENTSGSFIHLSYTFDASVTGIFLPLLSGKTVVIGSKQSLEIFEDSNLEKYAPYDFIKITPGHLELLHSKMRLQDGRQLTKKLVIGGEALFLNQLSYLTEEGMDVTIVNEYGPTETTVGCSTYSFNTKVKNENLKNNISIGKPIDNIRIYILGRQNELLPAGIPGEICIGGDSVARGYLNLPQLSKEKFIKDPFSNEAGARLYKSGDLGMWMPDGNIEYMGRTDEQLKIRGYRIEPGEIEECIASVSGVRSSKVIAAEGGGSKKLNAYVQIDKDKLPLLSNYEQLLSKSKIQKSNLNILPNGLPILSHNLNEVKFLYNEIFEDHCYLKHGITLNEDSVVIDIGANVGFFTVFLNALSKNIKVYSIEPIPEVYDLLSANRELYNIPGKAFELAIQETEKDLDFTYYPQVSIVSGISEDIDEVKEVVRSYIENSENGELKREDVDSLLEVKLESKRIKCKAKSISQIIEEEKIDKIDLLKVDVENSEHLVIDGIAEKDWAKIDSIIIEVHDTEGRLERIKQILKQRGFETYVEKEQMLSKDAILYNLFAIRDGVKKNISTMGERDKSRSAEWRDPADVVKSIKSELEIRLPDYMMPSNIILLDQFPLTKNGKIDKKALPDPDVTENLSNEYSVARNDLEEVLVEIWQDLLETESVGIHDNFFELGGDSIIIIQIVSRARRAGFELQVSDIFSYQTIAKLSQAVNQRNGSSVTTSSEQGLLEGDCGLLPIQQWYFEKGGADISHFNQSVLLSIEKSAAPEMLSYAIEKMISRHDALRFRYNKRDGVWTQEYGTVKAGLTIENLKSPDKESFSDLIKDIAESYQRSLNIEKGEIVKFVLVQTPESEKQNRLLIIIHHLAIDGVSWRILLEDLEIFLTEIQSGVKESSVQKCSSYRQWYEALEQYGQSSRLKSQSRYWEKAVSSYKPLKADKEFSGEVRLKDIHTLKILLDSKQTHKLLQEVPRVYHTEINDILLCALALTISERYSNEKVIIGLEGHGRETVAEGIDTTGTVGWFTNLYPVLLELKAESELSDAIRNVKEQLRSVPDKGLGYGVLKYINRDENIADKNCWEIVFNYLGQLDNVVSNSKWLSAAKESSGTDMSGDVPVSEKLSINAFIQGGELNINWKYSSLHFEKETISRLAEKYLNILQTLIQHCTEDQRSNVIHTPSDFGLGSEISIDELDNFLNEKL